MIDDIVWACVWVTGIVCFTIYSLAQLRRSGNPVSQIHKAGELLNQGLITEDEFRKIKSKMMRRIG